ncbi:MAG: hypothetical protein ACK4YP_05320 [Myxococcota bacterium]
MATRYRLPDEPRPGALANVVVHPMWPLLAVMFAGPWLSWPWFVLNAWALGSPTRVRETLYALGGFLGSAALLGAIVVAVVTIDRGEDIVPYLMIGVTVWKLAVSYVLSELQGRGFELYTWYGGVARNGFFVAVLGGMLLRPTIAGLVGAGLLQGVLL